MDPNRIREVHSFGEEEDEAIRGKHRYCYPFSSSTRASTAATPPLQYNGGFIDLINHHNRPRADTWLGDQRFKAQEDNLVQVDYGSVKNIKFMDLSMSLQHCKKDEEGEEGGVDSKNSMDLVFEKEHMFEKAVTPSDVGKLNRLVIPKQHAERFFPLDSSAISNGGLVLSFEDCTGKSWQFRYSYWNSSQSYVMTRGWSRFVKEKKLKAGDIVSFQRGAGDKGRLFIDWRHRLRAWPEMPMSISYPGTVSFPRSFSFHRPAPMETWSISCPSNFSRDHRQTGLAEINDTGINPSWSGIYGNAVNSKFGGSPGIHLGSSPAERSGCVYGGGIKSTVVFESVPVVQGTKIAMMPTKKQIRLFGVNMDYPTSESDESETHNLSSSQSSQHPRLNVYDAIPVPSGCTDKGKGSTSSSDIGI